MKTEKEIKKKIEDKEKVLRNYPPHLSSSDIMGHIFWIRALKWVLEG